MSIYQGKATVQEVCPFTRSEYNPRTSDYEIIDAHDFSGGVLAVGRSPRAAWQAAAAEIAEGREG